MITVKHSPEADTRTAQYMPTKDELLKATMFHIKDVQNGCEFFAQKLIDAGKKHDHTKIEYLQEFFDDFVGRAEDTRSFKQKSWWQKHLTERHHLNDRVPPDVNLIDVMEMIIDCTMAGAARNGAVFDVKINSAVLERAVRNTQEMLEKEIVVKENGQQYQ